MRLISLVKSSVSAALLSGLCLSASAQSLKPIFAEPAQAVAVPSRIVDAIDDAKAVKLPGNTHPRIQGATDKGMVEPQLAMDRMQLVLQRSPEQEAALERFMAEQQDPASPNFHHWLHAADLGSTYGVSESDIQKVTSWLEGHGLRVDAVSGSRMFITFSGTAAQVQQAFHVEMHRYDVRGELHLSNNTDPSIPVALSPVVAGVQSLNDFFARPAHASKGDVKRDKDTGKWSYVEAAKGPRPALVSVPKPAFTIPTQPTYPPNEDVSPYDFATIYNVAPLWTAGVDGTGVDIAIAGRSNITLSDVATFRSFFGLPVKAPTVIVNGTDPGIPSAADHEENTLDVEWSGAVAKGANIKYVESANTMTSDGATLSAQYIIENETAHIMSYSYQSCELEMGAAGNTAENTLWQQAAAAGISVFVASGDYASAQCDGGQTAPYLAKNGTLVSGLASTPYDTAVGGTDLNWVNNSGTDYTKYWNSTNAANGSSVKGYIPEVPWNDTCGSIAVDTEIGATGQGADPEQTCYSIITISGNSEFDVLVNAAGGSGGKSSCIAPTGTTEPTCAAKGGYPKPSWQTGTGVPNDNARDVPDVSLFAADGVLQSAYLVCDTAVGACDYTNSDAYMQSVGGTSVASPAMAGIMALVVQKHGNQGLANPTLYKLAANDNRANCNSTSVASGNACNFYDVTTDSIDVPCSPGSPNCTVIHTGDTVGLTTGWSSTTGYDLATGLGSINANNLVTNWGTSNGSGTLSITPSSLDFGQVNVGSESGAQTVTLKNMGTATITIDFTHTGFGGTGASSYQPINTTCNSDTMATLAAGASCSLSLAFEPIAAGSQPAYLQIADSAAGSPQQVPLSGTGIGTGLTITPASLTFPSTTVGKSAATQAITLTNNTGSAVTFTASTTITGSGASSFAKTASTCTNPLAAGASCTNTITFTPAAPGTLAATVTYTDSASGTPQTVALSGTGASASTGLTITPSSLTFASTPVGTAAATQVITLKNSTSSSVAFTASTTITGTGASSFAKTASTCTNPLAAGASCTNTITFTPASSGTLTATVTYTDSASSTPQTVALSGTGASASAGLTITPSSLTFASTPVGTAAATQVITLKNNTSSAVTFTASTTITGSGASSFAKTASTCTNPLAAGASCTNTITFTPASSGTLTATVTYTDSASSTPQTVALSGTGASASTGLTITPSLSFASTPVGTAAAAQMITLKNNTSAAVTFTASTTITGPNASSFAKTASTCTNPLAAGASCTNTITFTPAAAGALIATVTYTDSASSTPQTVSLSGTGASSAGLTITPSLTFASTPVGTAAAVQLITLKNNTTAAVTFTVSTTITGTNASSFAKTASTCTNPLAAGASCTNTITFTPAATGSLAATVTYTDTASSKPQTVALFGTGQ